jgi:hypothetical protein
MVLELIEKYPLLKDFLEVTEDGALGFKDGAWEAISE